MTIGVERQIVPRTEHNDNTPIWKGERLWVYVLLLSFALVLLCLLQFQSWIAFEQGVSSDARNPFATPFYLVDKGYLAVLDVSARCDYVTQTGTYTARPEKVSERLTFKQRKLLPCTMSMAYDPRRQGSSVFSVVVSYRVAWLPMHRCETFKLKSVVLADGTCLWIREQ